jgi:hypothetical protein
LHVWRPPGAMVIGRFSDATKKVINLTLTFVVFGQLSLTFSGNCRSLVLVFVFRQLLSTIVVLEQLLLIPPLHSSLQHFHSFYLHLGRLLYKTRGGQWCY